MVRRALKNCTAAVLQRARCAAACRALVADLRAVDFRPCRPSARASLSSGRARQPARQPARRRRRPLQPARQAPQARPLCHHPCSAAMSPPGPCVRLCACLASRSGSAPAAAPAALAAPAFLPVWPRFSLRPTSLACLLCSGPFCALQGPPAPTLHIRPTRHSRSRASRPLHPARTSIALHLGYFRPRRRPPTLYTPVIKQHVSAVRGAIGE